MIQTETWLIVYLSFWWKMSDKDGMNKAPSMLNPQALIHEINPLAQVI